jgi:competence protein ComEA
MKTFWAAALGVVGGLCVAGAALLVSSRPRGQPIQLLPPPTPASLVIHLVGAVVHPDVYTLPPGSHIQDAIQAGGGLLPDADPQAVNLAAPVEDGAQIVIPFRSTQAVENATSVNNAAAIESTVVTATPRFSQRAPGASTQININTASQAELESLPGIGPVLAKRIIEYRQVHGPFAEIQDIERVSGIGPATYQKIKELITVGDNP